MFDILYISMKKEKTVLILKRNVRMILLFTVAAFLPYLLYGFQYFPILDDFIQYGGYPNYEDVSYVYLTIGTVVTRPLAALLDPVFWGSFWSVPGVALVLMVLLQLASGFLLYHTLKRLSLTPSPLFLLLYLLFPLGMEGRYWLSASTRIIVGLFFASLALYALSRYMTEQKKPWYLALFALFQLLSCGFYEAVAVFAAGAACLLFLLKPEKKNIAIPVISVINVGLMFTYYKLVAGMSALGSRVSGFALSALPRNILDLFRQLLEQIPLTYRATVDGCTHGVRLLFSHGAWGIVVLVLVLIVSVLVALCSKENRPSYNKKKTCIFVFGGLALFFAPLVPNLMTSDVWITNRSMFIPLIGLFLLIEPLVCLFKGRVRSVIFFLCAFICLTAGINEYDVYRRVSEQDIRLVDEMATQLDAEALSGEKKVQVILKNPVVTEQNAFYKDHVKSVFGADWSLSGAVRARTGAMKLVCSEPIAEGDALPEEECLVIYLN